MPGSGLEGGSLRRVADMGREQLDAGIARDQLDFWSWDHHIDLNLDPLEVGSLGSWTFYCFRGGGRRIGRFLASLV